MKRIILSLIFSLFLSSLSLAAELPQYFCYRLTESPLLDGKIEEKAWSFIPMATGFFVLRGSYAIHQQTFLKAGWSKEVLYLAIKGKEPAPEKLRAEFEDGDRLWIEDGFEFFFFPQGAGNYLQFIINVIASRWNGIGFPSPPKPFWD